MDILKNVENERMLLGCLRSGNDVFRDGIYEEVYENEIRKKDRIDKLGGCGVMTSKYYRSNTRGVAHGKYFKKIADRINFIPKYHDELEEIFNSDISPIEKLEALNKVILDIEYRFDIFIIKDNIYDISLIDYIPKEDFIPLDHEYIEYAEYFRGKDIANIHINIRASKQEVDNIRALNKRFLSNDDLINIFNNDSFTKMRYTKTYDSHFYGAKGFPGA